MKKTIVIFADSVKHGQHCIAGKEILTKQWVRPVSNQGGGALSDAQVCYKNIYGTFSVKLLQKMEIEFLFHAPQLNQPENYVVKAGTWTQCFNLTLNEIDSYLDDPHILWNIGSSSSYGLNDRISIELIERGSIVINQSLYLIKPENVKFIVSVNYNNNKRIRVSFNYKGYNYNLATTDPIIWKWLENEDIGTEHISGHEDILCISLGESFNDGYCYKLVASAFF